MATLSRIVGKLTFCLLALLLIALPAEGRPIGGQFAQSGCVCKACSSCNESSACGCALSNSEGNLKDRYRAGITIVPHYTMSAANKTLHHERAHLSESNHPEFHLCLQTTPRK